MALRISSSLSFMKRLKGDFVCPSGTFAIYTYLPFSRAATQSFGLFSLRRVLGDCVSVWFRAATQSSEPFFLRRVHC